LDAVVQADLSKTSTKDKAIVYGILYDKGRLERGKATAHVAVLAGLIAHSDKTLFAPQAVVLHKQHTQPAVDTQSVVRDTPTTPIPRGTGGLEGQLAAVGARDPQVIQRDHLVNDINKLDDQEDYFQLTPAERVVVDAQIHEKSEKLLQVPDSIDERDTQP
jgi:hypothetical protein